MKKVLFIIFLLFSFVAVSEVSAQIDDMRGCCEFRGLSPSGCVGNLTFRTCREHGGVFMPGHDCDENGNCIPADDQNPPPGNGQNPPPGNNQDPCQDQFATKIIFYNPPNGNRVQYEVRIKVICGCPCVGHGDCKMHRYAIQVRRRGVVLDETREIPRNWLRDLHFEDPHSPYGIIFTPSIANDQLTLEGQIVDVNNGGIPVQGDRTSFEVTLQKCAGNCPPPPMNLKSNNTDACCGDMPYDTSKEVCCDDGNGNLIVIFGEDCDTGSGSGNGGVFDLKYETDEIDYNALSINIFPNPTNDGILNLNIKTPESNLAIIESICTKRRL